MIILTIKTATGIWIALIRKMPRKLSPLAGSTEADYFPKIRYLTFRLRYMAIVQALISLAGGGFAGGCTSMVLNRRFHLRKLRAELYPQVETMTNAYAVRSLLPAGKGWIVNGKRFRPGLTDDEFLEQRREFIARLVGFHELGEARALRQEMFSSELNPFLTDRFPLEVLEAESRALSNCFATLKEKLGLC